MPIARIITLDVAFTETAGLPLSIDYGSYFAGLASLLGWFDLSRSDLVTQAGSGVSAVAARAGGGSLSLAQATDANRPTYDSANGRLLFDASGTQFMVGGGNHPTTAVTIAAILRRSADSVTTEGVFGSTSPGTGSHSLFFQSNGELRYRVTDGTNTTFEEPADPVPPLSENVLVLADYDQSTDQARCRLADGFAGSSFATAVDITMNTTWFLGALSAAGASPANMELADLFVFNQAHIGDDVGEALIAYARALKGVA